MAISVSVLRRPGGLAARQESGSGGSRRGVSQRSGKQGQQQRGPNLSADSGRPQSSASALSASSASSFFHAVQTTRTRATEQQQQQQQQQRSNSASSAMPPIRRDLEQEEEEDGGEGGRPRVRVVGTFVEGASADAATSTTAVSNGAAVAKPLKINLDLLLFRTRTLRHRAFYVRDKRERAKMMREVEAGFRRAIEMDPTDGRAYVSLGGHYLKQRRFDESARVYEDGCAATQGQNAHIWQAWATLEAKRGNVNKARKYYDAATVASESHVTAWHGWGLLEERQGNFIRARELWTKGLQRAKTPSPYIYQSLGLLCQRTGLIEEARSWFRRGTQELKGVSAHAIWQAWALMEWEQGSAQEARVLFRKGLQANPRGRFTFLAWGSMEQELGNLDRARTILAEGLSSNPLDPALYQALGVLEEEAGNFADARKYFKDGLEVDDRHIHLWQAYGVMEWRLGHFEVARELFQKGIWCEPDSRSVCRVFQAWGCLEQEDGNIALARNLLKCAVKADPTSDVSWSTWVRLEESIGAYERADDIRNFSMQERVEVVTPQLTSADLKMGKDGDAGMAGVGPASFAKAVQQISKWVQQASKTPSRKRGSGPIRSALRGRKESRGEEGEAGQR